MWFHSVSSFKPCFLQYSFSANYKKPKLFNTCFSRKPIFYNVFFTNYNRESHPSPNAKLLDAYKKQEFFRFRLGDQCVMQFRKSWKNIATSQQKHKNSVFCNFYFGLCPTRKDLKTFRKTAISLISRDGYHRDSHPSPNAKFLNPERERERERVDPGKRTHRHRHRNKSSHAQARTLRKNVNLQYLFGWLGQGGDGEILGDGQRRARRITFWAIPGRQRCGSNHLGSLACRATVSFLGRKPIQITIRVRSLGDSMAIQLPPHR